MTLYDRIKSDNQRILTDEMGTLKLINKVGAEQTGKGRWTAIGMAFNPQGHPIASNSYKVDFHIDNFSTLISSSEETFKAWSAEFTNSTGQLITGTLENIMVDKTLGYVSAMITPTRSTA